MKKYLVNQFDYFLSQGSSKILINFSLNPSCGSYRTTIHPYRIGFLSTTRVRSCDDLPDALTGFEPVNYRDILDGTLNTDYLVGNLSKYVIFANRSLYYNTKFGRDHHSVMFLGDANVSFLRFK